MNDYDRANLSFLLKATPEEIERWYHSVDDDDRIYASELLKNFQDELTLKEILIQDPKIIGVNLAEEFLQRFKIGKK